MLTGLAWVNTINDIKYYEAPFIQFLVLVVISPLLIVFDIILIPLEILYAIYSIIQEAGKK